MNSESDNAITAWLSDHALPIAVIIVGSYLLQHFSGKLTRSIVRRLIKHDRHLGGEAEGKRREDTLVKTIHRTMTVVIYLIAGMMVLSEFGIDIGPLIAGAGIIGVALGFGGQWLIRDLISGIFIIIENQYRVGDVVNLDGTSGMVEDIDLRMTTLRDLDGNVHHVPNGSIKRATNLSKGYSSINLNVSVAYESDIEKVIKIVNEVGKKLSEEDDWVHLINEPPQFLRIDDFGDNGIVIKITGQVKPLQQWAVTGELRKRLKIAFDKHGIEIPYPQRVIHQKK